MIIQTGCREAICGSPFLMYGFPHMGICRLKFRKELNP